MRTKKLNYILKSYAIIIIGDNMDKRRKGFTLIELISVLVIIAIIGMIVYPRVTNIVETNKKKAFVESVKSTIRSYDSYLASENYPDIGEIDVTSGVIPTLDVSNWESGILTKYGDNIYVENFYDGNFCAFGYEDSLVVVRGKCQETPSSCFTFNESTKAITNYKVGGACTKTVIVPTVIKGVNVERIEKQAFYNKGIEYIILPSTLKHIGEKAFAGNKLTTITIPNNVIEIGVAAFNNNRLPDHQAFIYKKNADKTFDTSYLVSYGGKKRSDVIIPDNVVTIGTYAFTEDAITSVRLNNNVNKIMSYAFYQNNLTEIDFPPSLKTIENHAFARNKIGILDIPSTINSIGNWCFEYNALYEVSIPEGLSAGIGLFHYNNLSTVEIPSDWTTIPESTFRSNKITEVEIPDNITQLGPYAFFSNLLTEIDLNNVEIVGAYAFQNNKLISLHVPTATTSIGSYSFQNNLIETLTFADDSTLTNIWDYAFHTNKIKELTLPDSVRNIYTFAFQSNLLETLVLNNGLVSIGKGAFQKNLLEHVNYPSTLISLGICIFNFNKFTGAEALTYNVYPEGGINYTQVIGYAGEEEEITIPTGVTQIGQYAFENNKTIKKATLPEGLLSIGDGAFNNSALNNVNLPSTLTSINNYAFQSCGLTSVTIPNSVTFIGYQSFYNNQIKNLTLGNSVKTINGGAFRANKIESLVIPETVETINDYAFLQNNISSLSLPENKYIFIGAGPFNKNNLTGNDAFIYKRHPDGSIDYTTLASYADKNKTSVTVPSNVKIIGDGAFIWNTAITEIIIPEGVRELGLNALHDCNIQSIELPKSLISIGQDALAYNNFKTILIPENVSYIHTYGLRNCSGLTKVRIDREINSIDGAPWGATNAIIEWLR